MHTVSSRRGEGLGKQMLLHLIYEAKLRKFNHLSLETGSQAGFLPARKLYEAHGFQYCGPFADYKEDPNSIFMTLDLTN